MGRARNFYYQPAPTAAIGSSLARALFGDPAAAEKQREAQAKMDALAAQAEEARAHGGLYTSQTTGQDTANTAQSGLPGLVAEWVKANGPAPAPISLSDPRYMDLSQPMPQPEPLPDKGSALAALIGGIGQMQGDKIDPTKIMGSVASFAGDDELARRGLIAQGHSPTKDFAITPERADEIAGALQASELAKALGVAQINNRDDIPVAQIGARSRENVALTNNRDDIPVANIRAGASRDVAGIRAAGPAPGFDAIQRVFPNATMTSGLRSPDHNREVGGVANSYHLGQAPGIQAYDMPAQSGVSIQEAKLRIEAANPSVKVIEARDETGRVGPNGKELGGWHFTLQHVGGGKDAKPPRPLSPATHKALEAEMVKQIPGFDGFTPRVQAFLIGRAEKVFQKTGTISGAVQQAINENHAEAQARKSGGKRLSVAEATKLPKGTKFIGEDGVARTRQ